MEVHPNRVGRRRAAAAAVAGAAALAAAASTGPAAARVFPSTASADAPAGAVVLSVRLRASDSPAAAAWLELVDLDGTGRRPLTQRAAGRTDELASWSPDGRSVAFVRRTATQSALFVVPTTGGAPRRLLRLPRRLEPGRPVWSRDGRRLALALNSSGAPGSALPGRIAVVGVDGSRPVSFPSIRGRRYTIVSELSWAPGGWRLAYLAEACCGNARPHLHVAGAGGGGQQRIRAGRLGESVEWSPDGRRVLFMQCFSARGRCSVLETDPRGGSARVLVSGLSWYNGDNFALHPAGDEVLVGRTLFHGSTQRHVLQAVRRRDLRVRELADSFSHVVLVGISRDRTTVIHSPHVAYLGGGEHGFGFTLTRVDGSRTEYRYYPHVGPPGSWTAGGEAWVGRGLPPGAPP